MQKIIVSKRFGPLMVGHPEKRHFPKCSSISDCLKMNQVTQMELIEVRTHFRMSVSLTQKQALVYTGSARITCPLSRLEDKLSELFPNSLKCKFRVVSYTIAG